ncbi:MAG: hypothetical protein OES78_04410 [Chromatiales bacterium]|jgi:acetylornithine/succinyldiaminopimelate/putrescine aminotransferase|nr:hypothetical protein [Chromatiales bacterium]MDH3893785.1 hypothetical protein [Chromatiales bacterium]MDH3931569.1 hypothetical protein [Chromatiales bacterium]MDH4014463.1 hypothetical protein [Chromatiales bacterium]PLX57533.1 MAG: hypothetical protein C0629_01855 [Chromatiales bacterium]
MTASKQHNYYRFIGRVAAILWQRRRGAFMTERIVGAGGLAVAAEDMLAGSREMLQALQSGDTGEAE